MKFHTYILNTNTKSNLFYKRYFLIKTFKFDTAISIQKMAVATIKVF